MPDRIRIRQDGKYVWVDTDEGDARTNPYFSCDLAEPDEQGHKRVLNWMAFDPRYGPDTEAQIEWHRAHGTPRAETFEVGVPV